MFTLLCCADLNGEKVNLEITLEHLPRTVGDLKAAIAQVFNAEWDSLRPWGFPSTAFHIARVQIYDDALLCWADLVSLEQVREYDQLYVFQPQTQWHRDTQRDLPPPRPPLTGGGGGGRNAYDSYGGRGYSQRQSAPPHNGSPAMASHSAHLGQPHTESMDRGSSPVMAQLHARTEEEEVLLARLQKLRTERDALEREAEREMEAARRRQAEDTTAQLQRQEAEVWQQREALRRAEEQFQNLLIEKQKILSTSPLHNR